MRAVSRKVSSSSHSPEAGVVPMTEQPSSNGNAAVPETTDWAVADAGKGKAKAAPAKRQRWRSRKLYPDLDDRQDPAPKPHSVLVTRSSLVSCLYSQCLQVVDWMASA